MAPLARPAQAHSSWQSRRGITGTPDQRRLWGGARRGQGGHLQAGAGQDSAGRRGPSGGRGLGDPRLPPTPAHPRVPEELPDALQRPLRTRFLSRFPGDAGNQLRRPSTRTRCGSSVPCIAGGSRRAAGGGARSSTAAGPPAAARPRPPGLWARAPRARRPPAGSPDRLQPARPGLGAGPGGGAGGGAAGGGRRVARVTVTCPARAGPARRLHILGSEEAARAGAAAGSGARSSGGRSRHVAAAALAAPAAAAAASARPPAVLPPSRPAAARAPSSPRPGSCPLGRELLSFFPLSLQRQDPVPGADHRHHGEGGESGREERGREGKGAGGRRRGAARRKRRGRRAARLKRRRTWEMEGARAGGAASAAAGPRRLPAGPGERGARAPAASARRSPPRRPHPASLAFLSASALLARRQALLPFPPALRPAPPGRRCRRGGPPGAPDALPAPRRGGRPPPAPGAASPGAGPAVRAAARESQGVSAPPQDGL